MPKPTKNSLGLRIRRERRSNRGIDKSDISADLSTLGAHAVDVRSPQEPAAFCIRTIASMPRRVKISIQAV